MYIADTQGLPCSLGSIPGITAVQLSKKHILLPYFVAVVWSGFIGRQSCLGDRRNMVIRNGEAMLFMLY